MSPTWYSLPWFRFNRKTKSSNTPYNKQNSCGQAGWPVGAGWEDTRLENVFIRPEDENMLSRYRCCYCGLKVKVLYIDSAFTPRVRCAAQSCTAGIVLLTGLHEKYWIFFMPLSLFSQFSIVCHRSNVWRLAPRCIDLWARASWFPSSRQRNGTEIMVSDGNCDFFIVLAISSHLFQSCRVPARSRRGQTNKRWLYSHTGPFHFRERLFLPVTIRLNPCRIKTSSSSPHSHVATDLFSWVSSSCSRCWSKSTRYYLINIHILNYSHL